MKSLLSTLAVSACVAIMATLSAPAAACDAHKTSVNPADLSEAKSGCGAATQVSLVADSTGCGDKAECSASKSECAVKVSQVADAACGDKSGCGGDKVKNVGNLADAAKACPVAAEQLALAKGGADGESIKEGYKLGYRVPAFTLEDTEGKKHDLAKVREEGKPALLMFYNHSCPYVVEMWDRFDEFHKQYSEKIHILAIDAGFNHSIEQVAAHAEQRVFPIAHHPTSKLARKFEATRTPEVFILDRDGVIVYHGMFDNGQRGSAEGARRSYAQYAVEDVLAGRDVEVPETRAFGCRLVYNPVSAPDAEETASEATSSEEVGG